MDALRLLSRSSGIKLNKISSSQGQTLPSAGGNVSSASDDIIHINSKKRSRVEFEENSFRDLDEAEIRKIQKQHKIKITDLNTRWRKSVKSKSDSVPQTRKAKKEAARLFPQSLQSFSQLRQLGVSKALVLNIADQAYHEPTEVQIAAIPLLLRVDEQEPDLLAIAPTGSGKTLAFLIPLIEKIVKRHRRRETDDEKHVGALILAPTKELVGQIVNEGRKLAAGTGVRITEMKKGMQLTEPRTETDPATSDEDRGADSADESEGQKIEIIVKADILVSTPQLLLNSITRSDSTTLPLPDIHTLVLDEADYLLDLLFRDQVMAIWAACSSSELRTSLWSATIGSSIEELAMSTIASRIPKRSSKTRPLFRTIVGLKDTSLPTIRHKLVYASNEPGKLMGLRQLLHPAPSSSKDSVMASSVLRPPFLVFTQTIPRATALHGELKYDIPASAGGSSRIAVLHSDLSSAQRAQTMTEFRQGKIWILITTDLLSRGVDFRGVNGVVNYDIPTTAASYIHRAGRTGRAGREGGICVTYYTREDIKYLKPIASLIRTSEQKKSTSASTIDAEIEGNGIPSWLLLALPELSKQDRKELKQRGVGVRRAVKESDTKEERREKGKNRIGTSSGYERRVVDRTKGMIEGSKRRKEKAQEQGDEGSSRSDDGFQGFGD